MKTKKSFALSLFYWCDFVDELNWMNWIELPCISIGTDISSLSNWLALLFKLSFEISSSPDFNERATSLIDLAIYLFVFSES